MARRVRRVMPVDGQASNAATLQPWCHRAGTALTCVLWRRKPSRCKHRGAAPAQIADCVSTDTWGGSAAPRARCVCTLRYELWHAMPSVCCGDLLSFLVVCLAENHGQIILVVPVTNCVVGAATRPAESVDITSSGQTRHLQWRSRPGVRWANAPSDIFGAHQLVVCLLHVPGGRQWKHGQTASSAWIH